MIVALLLAAATPMAAEPLGVWINPRRTVKVAIRPCGEGLCGRVTWAAAEAIDDARDGGVDPLVGTELLQDYRPTGALQWQGRVFVPDLNRTFFSRIVAAGEGRLTISGCILGGLLCKSQIWTRA